MKRVLILYLSGLSLIILSSLLVPAFSPYEPTGIDLDADRLAPSISHPFGTDELGRDMHVRTAIAATTSLGIAASVAIITTVIAFAIGLLAANFRRNVDPVLMRLTDLMLALPPLIILIIAAAFFGGGSPIAIVLILSALGWMQPARAIRSHIITVLREPFVVQARQMGADSIWTFRKHILPASYGYVVTVASITFTTALLAETTLSFLGLGVQPPTPTLGGMLADTLSTAFTAPWLAIFPGLVIVGAALFAHGAGDAAHSLIDPLHDDDVTVGPARKTRRPNRPQGIETTQDNKNSPPPLVELKEVSATIGERRLFTNISFKLGAGETVALIGRSGSGKTTLGHSILGLPTAAEIKGGINITGSPLAGREKQIRGKIASMIFQEPGIAFLPARSIGWTFNQVLSATTRMNRALIKDAAIEAIKAVHLDRPEEVLSRLPTTFSSGELQRLGIALAIAQKTKLLVADEPTASLDTVRSKAIIDLLHSLQKKYGFALILITHDLSLVYDVADKVQLISSDDVDAQPIELSDDSKDMRKKILDSGLLSLDSSDASDLVDAARRLR